MPRHAHANDREKREREDGAGPPVAAALGPGPAAVLALQRTAGNHATTQLLQRQEEPGLVQGAVDSVTGIANDLFETGEALGTGARAAWELDDEGAWYARELMAWRVAGAGAEFAVEESNHNWNTFMHERPEIQWAMLPVLEEIAREAAADGITQKRLLWDDFRVYKRSITDVRLSQLESMRLTLHGCHRIDISATVYVSQNEDGDTIVEFARFVMTWIDVGDLHPGTGTEVGPGEVVDDSQFAAVGWDYPIRITFAAPDHSVWRLSGGAAIHEKGWPHVDGAPEGGFRG